MPQADRYYLVDFEAPDVTNGKELMIVAIDPTASLKSKLDGMLLSRGHIVIDTSKKFPHFASKPEAEVAAKKLIDEWKALNPERIGATQIFGAGQANRILEVNKPEV